MTNHPTVSAIIPTKNRPDLVARAVRSVLAQTLADIEALVVIDGPDPDIAESLAAFSDRRLRVITLPESRGPAAARNTGVREAAGNWVAFLDDDDEWLPEKLLLQRELAVTSVVAYPIISCQVIVRTGFQELVWPSRFPEPGEHLSSYILDRRSPFSRSGFISSSTIFTRRDLLLKLPYPDYRRHEDWGWLLAAIARPDVRLDFVPRPLCTFEPGEGRESLSKYDDWRASLAWIRDHRDRVTPDAYIAFITSKVAGMARRQGEWAAFRVLLAEALSAGRPKLRHVLIYFGTWLLPATGHRWMRRLSFLDSIRPASIEPPRSQGATD